jgi:hypothetical protein
MTERGARGLKSDERSGAKIREELMTERGAGGPKSDERAVAKIWRLMKKWGVRIGVAAMVVLITLVHLHVIEGDILLLALSAVMLLLSEQLHELAAEVKTETESIAQQVRKRFEILEGLIESLSPNLRTLLDCFTDLNKLLSLHGDANRIVIEYIGLDMVHAWSYFEPLTCFNRRPS